MTETSDWLLWQLADSAFPTGGFAHSGGLEAAWQQGEVGSRAEASDFMKTSLSQLGHSAVPLVVAAHRTPANFAKLDVFCDRLLNNHVAKRASRLQGQALLIVAQRSFPKPALDELRRNALDQQVPGHLAPVFGVVTRFLEIDDASAVRLFLFLALRSVIASAVRLGIFGPMEAQALQFQLTPYAERAASLSINRPLSEIAQTAPLLDLFQGAHDRLYSRLFQS